MSSAFEGLPKTPNLKLNKPGYENVADIEALNENADILDEEIQGIKNTFVKSVNGINAGDDGNVDLDIIPIAKGGTGQTTASGVRNALGLGNTTGALPIANGGTGATTAANARTNLGLGSVATLNTVPIANGGTGATTASQARTNLGLSTAVTGASISGKTITLTKADGTTQTLEVKSSMPSNTNKIDLSTDITDYTAPADGWLVATAKNTKTGSWHYALGNPDDFISIGGYYNARIVGEDVTLVLPMSKGNYAWTNVENAKIVNCRFVYAESEG